MGYANGFSVDGNANPVGTQTIRSNVSVSVDANIYIQPVQSSQDSRSVDANVYIIGSTQAAASVASDANVYIQPVTNGNASIASDVNTTSLVLPARLRRWNGSFWERVPTTYVWNATTNQWTPVL